MGKHEIDLLQNPERWFAMYLDNNSDLDFITAANVPDIEDAPKTMSELQTLWDKAAMVDNKHTYITVAKIIKSLLEGIQKCLKFELPKKTFAFLARFMEDSQEVSVTTKLANAPPNYIHRYCNGMLVSWNNKESKNMGKKEEQRTWPILIDKIHTVCKTTDNLCNHATMNMSETIQEMVYENYQLDAAPLGPSLAWVSAGMGNLQLKLLNTLWWSGANMQKRSLCDGTLPIEVAAALGNVLTVERLYKMGCCIGRAVHFAICESQLSVLELILSPNNKRLKSGKCCGLGVSPNSRVVGITPLELAIITGNTPVAQFLCNITSTIVKQELSVDIRTRYHLCRGSYPLHLCARLGGSRDKLMQVIIKQDDKMIKQKDKLGRTASDICINPALRSVISSNKCIDCWDILYKYVLSPKWNTKKKKEYGR